MTNVLVTVPAQIAEKKIGSIAFIPGIYSESVVADSSGNIYTGLRAREGELEVIDDALKRIVIDQVRVVIFVAIQMTLKVPLGLMKPSEQCLIF